MPAWIDLRLFRRRGVRVLLFAIVGGVLAFCGGCATKDRPDPADDLYRYNGFTVWSCNKDKPVWFIRGGDRDSTSVRATVAHERSHAAFMASFPSCEAYKEWRANPENQLTLEALGACAALRQMVRDGQPTTRALAYFARTLAIGYGIPDLTPKRARQRIAAVCL